MKRAMTNARHRMGEGLGLTRTQLDILLLLAGGPKSTGDLARSLVVTQSATTQTIDTLVRQKLVERHPDEDDRRVVRLGLSPEGHRLTDQLCDHRRRFIKSLVDQLTDSEVESLISITGKLTNLLSVEKN
jgi:DNA-binding MarR family transcriptional regulator